MARVDGFLTAPSSRPAADIARAYLTAHPDVFGLDAAEVAALTLRKDYVDIEGTHHLSFVQTVGGVPVFGNGLKAHVTRNGRLLQVDGSPLASLPASLGSPGLTAAKARDTAVRDVFGTSTAVATKQVGADRQTDFSGGDKAQLVVFQGLDGPRLAWQTMTMREGYLHVLDAATGQVLFRQSMVHKDSGVVWSSWGSTAPRARPSTMDPAGRENSPPPTGRAASRSDRAAAGRTRPGSRPAGRASR